ncbi:DNA-binding response regulator [Planotetraspora thailandica]|uniref:DNA-binding response regulator n=1 Tax=Planotetraspora thailandica TaxID=487172 RepID=A0A8J3XYN8_9ACTN|nr:response regulator transcription factor [Planotetraspora thailandica]GII57501.1 DNA-binding response regulator [Planotetraspora thailandica]
MTDTSVNRIRVLLADDEVLIRGGVKAVLATDPVIEVVAEAEDGHQVIDLVQRHHPDVVLLDIRMPRLDGLIAMKEILAIAPQTKIIILTTFGEDDYIRSAFIEGAAGFLLKAADPRELISGVHAVMGGAAYLSPRIAQWVISQYRDSSRKRTSDAQQRVQRLTERERDVLAMLGAGLSNAEIGRRLYLVEGTVKGYVTSILIKLDARNRVQAAIIANEARLVPEQWP